MAWDLKTRTIVRKAMKRSLGGRYDYLATKQAEIDHINSVAVDGKVAVIFGGMDCDCSQYTGVRYEAPATFYGVLRVVDDYGKWADGPFGWRVASPDEEIVRTSRDLALEAFEDGHPHVVYG
jgi:hypothetical protein